MDHALQVCQATGRDQSRLWHTHSCASGSMQGSPVASQAQSGTIDFWRILGRNCAVRCKLMPETTDAKLAGFVV